MAFNSGAIIEASDYNTIIGEHGIESYPNAQSAMNRLGAIYGVGYGDRGYNQSDSRLPHPFKQNVSSGDIISPNEWKNITQMLRFIREHQNTSVPITIPNISDFISGGIIDTRGILEEVELSDSERLTPNIESKNLLAPSGVTNTTRVGGWSSSINCEFTITFTSEEHCRYWFNTGGQILIYLSHPTGNSQDNVWVEIINNITRIQIAAHNTMSRHAIYNGGTDIGYFELTDTFQNIFSVINPSSSGNNIHTRAKRNGFVGTHGGNGNTITIQVELTNGSSSVSGGTQINVNILQASSIVLTPPASPTCSFSDEL